MTENTCSTCDGTGVYDDSARCRLPDAHYVSCPDCSSSGSSSGPRSLKEAIGSFVVSALAILIVIGVPVIFFIFPDVILSLILIIGMGSVFVGIPLYLIALALRFYFGALIEIPIKRLISKPVSFYTLHRILQIRLNKLTSFEVKQDKKMNL